MRKLKKILKLTDPYPNLWYEIFCYLKTIFGLFFLILGCFLLFSSLFNGGLGIVMVVLGLGIFWQIKLIRRLIKILFPKL